MQGPIEKTRQARLAGRFAKRLQCGLSRSGSRRDARQTRCSRAGLPDGGTRLNSTQSTTRYQRPDILPPSSSRWASVRSHQWSRRAAIYAGAAGNRASTQRGGMVKN